MDDDLKQAVALLRRHAVRHNLPRPVLTVAPEWKHHLDCSVGMDTLHPGPRADRTMIAAIAVEVDYTRIWRKP